MMPVANDARDLSANGSTPLLEGATRRRRLSARPDGRSLQSLQFFWRPRGVPPRPQYGGPRWRAVLSPKWQMHAAASMGLDGSNADGHAADARADRFLNGEQMYRRHRWAESDPERTPSPPTGGPESRLHFASTPLHHVTDKFNPGAWTGAVGARGRQRVSGRIYLCPSLA